MSWLTNGLTVYKGYSCKSFKFDYNRPGWQRLRFQSSDSAYKSVNRVTSMKLDTRLTNGLSANNGNGSKSFKFDYNGAEMKA